MKTLSSYGVSCCHSNFKKVTVLASIRYDCNTRGIDKRKGGRRYGLTRRKGERQCKSGGGAGVCLCATVTAPFSSVCLCTWWIILPVVVGVVVVVVVLVVAVVVVVVVCLCTWWIILPVGVVVQATIHTIRSHRARAHCCCRDLAEISPRYTVHVLAPKPQMYPRGPAVRARLGATLE